MMGEDKNILSVIKPLIVELRRGNNIAENWGKFHNLVTTKTEGLCAELDTRWLVSVADTYADYGTEVEKRNAMLISTIVNMEKLWATELLMYNVGLNEKRLRKLKDNGTVPLWDGMYSFNINRGDMSQNLFSRIASLQEKTPALEKIYQTVIRRLLENDTVLANLNTYHKSLMGPPPKRSISRILVKKVRGIFKEFRFLFLL